jgi:sortase A
LKEIKNTIKATIFSIIVAFLFVIIIDSITESVCKEKFEMATNILSMLTINNDNKTTVEPILEDSVLINYPTYGTKYATLKIPSIDVNLPVYYGESYNILKSGIAHDSSSYFPGEGGSVVFAGHNFKAFLANLPKAQIGDEIDVETTYGNFKYQIYNTKIVQETAVEEVPIQREKEILMIYTCYPINNIGHATQRYVVYANLVSE